MEKRVFDRGSHFHFKVGKWVKNNARVQIISQEETKEWVDVLLEIYDHYWLNQLTSWS